MINADNGTENNTGRTQWIKRLVEFSAEHQVTVELACYPPYHSKYNPVERVFGVLDCRLDSNQSIGHLPAHIVESLVNRGMVSLSAHLLDSR